MLIDAWHFSFGDSTWDDLASVPLDRIAYVQFDDTLAPESDNLLADAMDRRALPGEGVLDLDRFVDDPARPWMGRPRQRGGDEQRAAASAARPDHPAHRRHDHSVLALVIDAVSNARAVVGHFRRVSRGNVVTPCSSWPFRG